MHHLPPCVPEEHARAVASQSGWFRRWILQAPFESNGRIECVWFPYYFLTFALDSPKGPGDTTVSVEGWSGAFSFITLETPLAPGAPPGEWFAPRLDETEAEDIGRRELLGSILRLRSRGPKPTPGALLACNLALCPIWVYYLPRMVNRIDLRVVDALTGELLGNRTRLGVISAFLERHA